MLFRSVIVKGYEPLFSFSLAHVSLSRYLRQKQQAAIIRTPMQNIFRMQIGHAPRSRDCQAELCRPIKLRHATGRLAFDGQVVETAMSSQLHQDEWLETGVRVNETLPIAQGVRKYNVRVPPQYQNTCPHKRQRLGDGVMQVARALARDIE